MRGGEGLSLPIEKENKVIEIKVTLEEYRLIETALEGDNLGTWGGDRGENIQKLLKKLKRERTRK